jgi:DNA-binding MarR family transcriptional regulator
MARVSDDSIESQLLDILKHRYPITIDELTKELRVNPKIITLTIKRLAARGIIGLDILPDKTYVRLLVLDGKSYQKQDLKNNRPSGYA